MNIDDSGEVRSRRVKVVFEPTVREIARTHRWNCLTARADLPRDTTAPLFEWTYQYELPTNCVRLLSLNGYEYSNSIQDDYIIEGRKILTEADEAKITYVQYTDDVGAYDPLFTEALVVLLASKLATIFRQDENLGLSLKSEYLRDVLPRARRVDGNERKIQTNIQSKDSLWQKSRRTSTNG